MIPFRRYFQKKQISRDKNWETSVRALHSRVTSRGTTWRENCPNEGCVAQQGAAERSLWVLKLKDPSSECTWLWELLIVVSRETERHRIQNHALLMLIFFKNMKFGVSPEFFWSCLPAVWPWISYFSFLHCNSSSVNGDNIAYLSGLFRRLNKCLVQFLAHSRFSMNISSPSYSF